MTTPVVIPAFLAQLIDEIAVREGFIAKAYTVTASSGSALGDGFQGLVLRCIIEGERFRQADQQLCLICKMPPADRTRREIFMSRTVFEREIHMYEKILPMLTKFQADLGISLEHRFRQFPKCYGSASNPETCDYALVMADLKADGFAMWNRFEELDFEHASLALAELGRLHAVSFAIRDQRPDLLEQLREIGSDLLVQMADQEVSRPVWTINYGMAAETLEDGETELKEKVASLAESYVDRLRESLRSEEAEPFAVFGHGDFWNNNMMFRQAEGSARTAAVCLIDWQLAQFSSPAIDLLYFLFSCTERRLRAEHFWDLIRVYHDSLAAAVRAMGSNPEQLFRYEDLRGQLKRFGQYAMCLAPMLVQVITARPEELPDFDEMSRNAEANHMEDFVGFVGKDNPAYGKRMSEMIRDYFSLGFEM